MAGFGDVFRAEIDVINFRRDAVRSGMVAEKRKLKPADGQQPVGGQPVADRQTARSTARRGFPNDLTGIALSGGGVRSASFCLGVMQGLESVPKKDGPLVVDAIDYLSTVSGGSYIGTSMVTSLMQEDHTFPFRSKLGEGETPETQHLRDYSNFLAPAGAIDHLTSAALVLRGLLINTLIVLPFLLGLAVLTVFLYPLVTDLDAPHVFGTKIDRPHLLVLEGLERFTLTVNLAISAGLLIFASGIYGSLTFRTGSLRQREILGRLLGTSMIVICAAFAFEFQSLVLSRMMAAPSGGTQAIDLSGLPKTVQDTLKIFGDVLPIAAGVLTSIVAVLVSAAQKLANVAKASLGEEAWTAILAKHTSRATSYIAAVIVPLLLWIAYLYLTAWAIRTELKPGCGPLTPEWLQRLTFCDRSWPVAWMSSLGHVGSAYLIAAALLGVVCLVIGPNSNSLHRLYRDRLSRAFLIERQRPAERYARVATDTWMFSSLKRFAGPFCGAETRWETSAALSPYLLVNTAINLEGSRKLSNHGRHADIFIFSPLHVGSMSTGYVPTRDMESVARDLTLAMGMATSGVDETANVEGHFVKLPKFGLSWMLPLRQSYWLPNPARVNSFKKWHNRWLANIGALYFAAEISGQLDEGGRNVFLTDGGHIENLGIYELLRRRCKVILAVDAEADPDMIFQSFVSLQMMARIDLGVRIELPWRAIQKAALEPAAPPGAHGPHAAIGIIRYDEDETGVLIYLKSSLTGDENDYVLGYRQRNPTFPQQTALDKDFNEEQFEVYRALGFHAARRLMTGEDDFAKLENPPAGWNAQVSRALELLNVPADLVKAVVAHLHEPPDPNPAPALDPNARPAADHSAIQGAAPNAPTAPDPATTLPPDG